MGLPAKKLPQRFSYKDYLEWDNPGERWELYDGEAVAMSPAPGRMHQTLAGNLFYLFKDFLKDKPCEVYIAPFDVRLPEPGDADEDTDTVVEPDILVVCDPTKLDERGCKGAPDLVVEVLSPHSAENDLRRKFEIYQKHKIREYWIIDPGSRAALLYRVGEDGLYPPAIVIEKGGKFDSTVLSGFTVEMEKLFAGI